MSGPINQNQHRLILLILIIKISIPTEKEKEKGKKRFSQENLFVVERENYGTCRNREDKLPVQMRMGARGTEACVV
jgi:hypothetical protein